MAIKSEIYYRHDNIIEMYYCMVNKGYSKRYVVFSIMKYFNMKSQTSIYNILNKRKITFIKEHKNGYNTKK